MPRMTHARRPHWQGYAFALAAAGLRPPWDAPLALPAGIAQMMNAFACHRHRRVLPVQVRLAFPLLFAAGSSTSALVWLRALQVVGVKAFLVADYYLLARLLALLRWNRRAPLTPALVRAVLTLPTGPGSVVERLPIGSAGLR
jgi:hypothetical protein